MTMKAQPQLLSKKKTMSEYPRVFSFISILLLSRSEILSAKLRGNTYASFQENLQPRPGTKTSAAASSKFDTIVWPELQEAICPNMVPNIELAKTRIFHLARERMGISKHFEQELSETQDNDDIYQRFFDFDAGIILFTSKYNESIESEGHNGGSFGYLPIWKCANDQLRYAMNESLSEHFDMVKRPVQIVSDIGKSNICFVTAIRDPISHFLSGYTEIETRFRVERMRRKYNEYVFNRYMDGSTKRFKMFLSGLLSGMKLEVLNFPFHVAPLAMPHVYLMSGILSEMARYNMTLTSYLPSLHNLTSNWPHFISSACSDVSFPSDFLQTKLEVTGQHRSSLDTHGYHRAALDVWKEGGTTAQAICILHVVDYACFDELEIPPLCKEVYNEERFRNEIFSNEKNDDT